MDEQYSAKKGHSNINVPEHDLTMGWRGIFVGAQRRSLKDGDDSIAASSYSLPKTKGYALHGVFVDWQPAGEKGPHFESLQLIIYLIVIIKCTWVNIWLVQGVIINEYYAKIRKDKTGCTLGSLFGFKYLMLKLLVLESIREINK